MFMFFVIYSCSHSFIGAVSLAKEDVGNFHLSWIVRGYLPGTSPSPHGYILWSASLLSDLCHCRTHIMVVESTPWLSNLCYGCGGQIHIIIVTFQPVALLNSCCGCWIWVVVIESASSGFCCWTLGIVIELMSLLLNLCHLDLGVFTGHLWRLACAENHICGRLTLAHIPQWGEGLVWVRHWCLALAFVAGLRWLKIMCGSLTGGERQCGSKFECGGLKRMNVVSIQWEHTRGRSGGNDSMKGRERHEKVQSIWVMLCKKFQLQASFGQNW